MSHFWWLVSFLLVLLLWWGITELNYIAPFFLPKPITVFENIFNGFLYKSYGNHLLTSFVRVMLAFSISVFLGISLSIIFCLFSFVYNLFHPIVTFLRYIPASAFLSLVVLWFGIDETGKVVLIFLGLFFYIVQMAYDSVSYVYNKYYDFCKIYEIKYFRKIWYILILGSLPNLIDTLRINYAAAWIFLIISEYVGGKNGIGFMMAKSQRYLKTEEMFAFIIVLGIVGIVSDFFFQAVKHQLCKER